MVRSHCIVPVVVVLALTGLAWGQASFKAPSAGDPTVNSSQPGGTRHPIVTVQEQDKPPEKCRVLKSWLLVDGSRAFQAQDVTTDEIDGIVETGPRTSATSQSGHYFQAVATRIYHWGSSNTPPEGTPLAPPSSPVVGLQPTSPRVVTPADRVQIVRPNVAPRPSACCSPPATTVASGSTRIWPAAYADGTTQTATASTPYAASSIGTTSAPQAPNAVTSNTEENTPSAAIKGSPSTLTPVPGSATALQPVPVVRVPQGSLQDIPMAQVIQVPATGPTSTAALLAQTPAVSPSGSPYAVRSTTDSTPDQRKPAHFGGLLGHLFSSDESTATGKNTTVLVQATPVPAEKEALPKATVKEVVASPVVQIQATTRATTMSPTLPLSTSTPPTQVKTSAPAVLPTFPTNSTNPIPMGQVLDQGASFPGPKAVDQGPARPMPPLPKLLQTKGTSPDVPNPSAFPQAAGQLPLAKVTPVNPSSPMTQVIPLATVKPVDSARQAPVKPVAPGSTTSGNLVPPLKMPLADSTKPDPFDNLGTYVKVPGQDISVQPAQPGQGISTGSAITPVGGVNPPTPGNPPSTGAPGAGPTGPGVPATPAATGAPGSVSAPPGRQSVLAAQAAAMQVSAEMRAPAPKTTSPMVTGAAVSAQEANAFSTPKGQPSGDDPRANAWYAPTNQMVQAPPGSMGAMPPGQARDMGVMMPPGQPMMPPPGRPMMVPAMPYQGAGPPMMCQPGMPPPEHCPVPCGYRNAFTQAGNSQPIPADMGHDPSNTDNAFQSISCATLAVPPGPVCCAQGCPGPGYPPPPGMAMMQPGIAPPGAMYPPRMPYAYQAVPSGPPMGMMTNPALAPVRVSEQQLAQAQPLNPGLPAAAPVSNPVQRVGAQVAMPANAPGVSDTATLPEILGVLNDSLYPSQREWAADRLTRFDWRVHPQIVECLLQAARDDPAPMVRIGCIHSLARLKAGTTFVVKALQEMKEKDRDTRVRQEAEQTLHAFMPGAASVSSK